MIVTSHKPFSAWDEIFGDDVGAAEKIGRMCTTPTTSPSTGTATGSAAWTSRPD